MNLASSSLIITLFFVISLFQSCGQLIDDNRPACCNRPNAPTDPTFIPYIEEFEFYAGVNASSAPIYFADLEPGVAGVCHYFRFLDGPIQWGYIEIDKPYWDTISEYQRINLIYHELGHCVLGRGHVPWGNSVMACPSSFMYDTVLSTECIQKNYDTYMKEMFPNYRSGQ